MCLRPPLMIPLVMNSVKPVPDSTLDNENIWTGKFRAIRWDNIVNRWLVSTSEGFYSLKNFNSVPERIQYAPAD